MVDRERMELMTSLCDHATRWAAERLDADDIPAQVDIDELSSEPPPRAVEAAIECVQSIRGLILDRAEEFDVALVIPLEGESSDLVVSSPSLAELRAQNWNYGAGREVPGIYLVRPSVWGIVEHGEEYRRLLDEDRVPPGFIAYYRAWRSTEEASRGWEFARGIYLRSIGAAPE
ncbi:hypothetical protein BJ980_001688 [Nocardioides daedukensis]|uniref:Uncharacterized protein n=1 Tax=Nocardioides daedukensis TaxID=634462 RepID=A0A7Y9RYV4_9ACTN|nr:hypothetical protein [Nocardioides daedukensis]NYG58765.1 hypothetical protein [Nocardioides daedukensis]